MSLERIVLCCNVFAPIFTIAIPRMGGSGCMLKASAAED
jgi:hypothetical protein